MFSYFKNDFIFFCKNQYRKDCFCWNRIIADDMQPDFFAKKMRQMIYLTHIIFMVEYSGLEPLTPTLPVWCSSQLS